MLAAALQQAGEVVGAGKEEGRAGLLGRPEKVPALRGERVSTQLQREGEAQFSRAAPLLDGEGQADETLLGVQRPVACEQARLVKRYNNNVLEMKR